MKTTKIKALLILVAGGLGILSGCGGGNGYVGSVGTLPPSVTSTGRANVSGTVFAPAGISAGRTSNRSATSPVGHDTQVANAAVTLNKMKSDGTLEEIPGYETTTDASGNYTLQQVPEGENYVIVAEKNVSVGGQDKDLKVKNIVSVDVTDTAAGAKTGVDPDVATTLSVEAVKDVIVTINTGRAESDKIEGEDLPNRKIEDLKTAVGSALETDAALPVPNIDTVNTVTEGDAAVDSNLSTLENTAHGQQIKNERNHIRIYTFVEIRVKSTAGVWLSGVLVSLTINGTTHECTTPASPPKDQGRCYFDYLDIDSDADVSVTMNGYTAVRQQYKTLKHGELLRIDIAMAPAATSGTGSVSGTVTDTAGQPVAEAVVKIYNDSFEASTLTGADGTYSFTGLPAGTYNILATKSGYTLESKTVSVQ